MMSVFGIFTLELIAHRLGTSYMDKLGISHDTHGPTVAHVSFLIVVNIHVTQADTRYIM